MYMPASVPVHHLCLWGLKRSEKGVGLEVWVVVSQQVGSKNQTCHVCKSNQCS